MSQPTKTEVLSQLRRRYLWAGQEHKRKLITQAVELLGYHRKAALRALRNKSKPIQAPALRLGRPREYHPEALLPLLKPIWFAAFQPCGSRLVALLPEWVPAYEEDHRRLDADVRARLLAVSARTLDRLLAPLRVALRRRGGTKPGSLLRQSIPICGEWTEEGSGWLELDTGALCGGTLDDRQEHHLKSASRNASNASSDEFFCTRWRAPEQGRQHQETLGRGHEGQGVRPVP